MEYVKATKQSGTKLPRINVTLIHADAICVVVALIIKIKARFHKPMLIPRKAKMRFESLLGLLL
jgi:hypothetical protein